MAKPNIKTKQGFTIIEVVLVLAIAGLIFLMVFIGFPALQRSQRDTQRRNDMSRFISQLSSYQTNNGGKVPANGDEITTFATNYLKMNSSDLTKSEFKDPQSNSNYTLSTKVCSSTSDCKLPNSVSVGTVYVFIHSTCDGENPSYKSGDRNVAVITPLEGGGNYCNHN